MVADVTHPAPLLLTPGPLSTPSVVREAMQVDRGSRDRMFVALSESIRRDLVGLIDGEQDFVCVPLQGSGTFTVEAMLTTLTPRDTKTLVVSNGAYGDRMQSLSLIHI